MTRAASGLALLVIAAQAVSAQTVERRVSGAPDGNVTFHFASRADVCGDGRNYIRADDMWMGSFNDGIRSQACERGPIRVLKSLIRVNRRTSPWAFRLGGQSRSVASLPTCDGC